MQMATMVILFERIIRYGLVGVVVTLLREVYFWRWALSFHMLKPGPMSLLLSVACRSGCSVSPTSPAPSCFMLPCFLTWWQWLWPDERISAESYSQLSVSTLRDNVSSCQCENPRTVWNLKAVSQLSVRKRKQQITHRFFCLFACLLCSCLCHCVCRCVHRLEKSCRFPKVGVETPNFGYFRRCV